MGSMPALLAKAEPISDSFSTSGIMYLRREGKSCGTTRVKTCKRNSSTHTKVSDEGGEGGASGARAEIHLQPLEDPTLDR